MDRAEWNQKSITAGESKVPILDLVGTCPTQKTKHERISYVSKWA